MIPAMDLKKQHLELKKELDKAISSVLDSGRFILANNVGAFEKEFSKYCNSKFGIGVANGTDAIHLALRANNIGEGDEVITVPNTAVPTVAAIEMVQAVPVFVDIDETFTIDVNKIESAITEKTKAIIPVHLFGNVCNMDPIIKIAKKHDLKIIEDCAQAHGAEYKGKKLPVSGTGCFSFYPTKNLGAYGDAGMVVTDDKEVAEKVKLLRCYGESKRYKNEIPGFNSRLDELQAAILRVKLKHLNTWTKNRRKLAEIYNKNLKNVLIPVEKDYAKHVYHLYVIRSKDRNQLRDHLKAKGISTLIHYPLPIHL
jgi:dTDP-4-amino-4,6-dideoxygalactose transaminase